MTFLTYGLIIWFNALNIVAFSLSRFLLRFAHTLLVFSAFHVSSPPPSSCLHLMQPINMWFCNLSTRYHHISQQRCLVIIIKLKYFAYPFILLPHPTASLNRNSRNKKSKQFSIGQIDIIQFTAVLAVHKWIDFHKTIQYLVIRGVHLFYVYYIKLEFVPFHVSYYC